MSRMNSNLSLAGLFAGVGGIELGFSQAGFSPVFANEIDERASETYRLNHEHTLITRDLHLLEAMEVPRVEVLTGGFPCQAFSVAGYRRGFEDSRGNLFWEIVRILERNKPPVVFLENVKNLVAHDGGKTFRVIQEALDDLGYHIKYAVLNADEYSEVPQNRERIYIVGFRSKKAWDEFQFPSKNPELGALSEYIDFSARVSEEFSYENRYMSDELKREITRTDRIYQWRRHYVRENKSGVCPTLTANMGTGGHNVPLILGEHGIRKLTPKECFNLMGFPDSFELPGGMANSHLYKQAGNAVVVPVIRAIAEAIRRAMEA
jgi:DNA (cytosine-5)-methyltransferase 1